MTWAFAPPALVQFCAGHFSTTEDFKGNVEPIAFHPNARFTGQGLNFGPEPMPVDPHWCCVEKPWCPTPFVVVTNVATVSGPLSGWAGRVWFIWTPFGLIYIDDSPQWVA
ncbi:hypothetical protein [Limnoglobus roseus]|uniref:hypothetical protein n=1 Tax=Limnoglobus roseus TaxID=2598579 RepID=UPI0011EAAD96|nr:hypothetical protein [Limnoglobus roseus]